MLNNTFYFALTVICMPSDFQRKFRQTQLPSSVYYRNDDAKGLPKSLWQSGDKKENRRFFMYLHCSKTSNIFVKIKWIRPHFNKHTSFWYWEHWNTWNVINMLSNFFKNFFKTRYWCNRHINLQRAYGSIYTTFLQRSISIVCLDWSQQHGISFAYFV